MVMTLEEIAHVGEIIGGIGVLGSLIFVGLQVRQNTQTVRASTLQQNTSYWTNFITTLAHPQFVTAYGKGMAGRDLDQIQFGQFFLLTRAYFLGLENQQYQYRQGLLDPEAFRSYELAIREQVFSFPGIRAMWHLTRHTYSQDFIAFVDRHIAATPVHEESIFRKWQTEAAAQRASI
jgi:hypothetical protein